jgi:hypothetical protein
LFPAIYEGVPKGEMPEGNARNDCQKEQQLIVLLQAKDGEQVIEAELSQDCNGNECKEYQPPFHFIYTFESMARI